jgi:hypothetical protein
MQSRRRHQAWEKKRLDLGEEAWSIRGELTKAAKLELGNVMIECKKGPIEKGTLLDEGRSSMTVKFKECKVTSPEEKQSCTVTEVKFVIEDLLFGETEIHDEIKLLAGSQAIILCGELEARYNLEGKHEKCNLSEGRIMKLAHNLVCTPPTAKEEEELKEAEPLRFTGTWEVELVEGDFWAVE